MNRRKMRKTLKELNSLPIDDRIVLVAGLQESIDAELIELEKQPIRREVMDEIDRRFAEYEADPSKSFTYAEVRRGMKSAIAKARQERSRRTKLRS